MGIISPIGTDVNSTQTTAGTKDILGKDAFLKLLITKLTNQDPLNPMEDAAFTAELAQFSSLEQLQKLNTAMETSQQWDYMQTQTINNTMATSLIGREVKANYNGIYLDEDNLPSVNFSTTEFAKSVKVEIMNSEGTVVRTIMQEDVPAGAASAVWDGNDEYGNRLKSGYYTVNISAKNSKGTDILPSTFIKGKVSGVVYREGSAYLQINGMEIPLSDVSTVSEA
ncbi:MAG: hypothetical protein NTV06_00865 [candidate division Zixibacteria bacterium]|nr:hypothetical protein [candidate division Zixibacteria bacterium]